jgi:imidazolonepropionase-like amidohydrolase
MLKNTFYISVLGTILVSILLLSVLPTPTGPLLSTSIVTEPLADEKRQSKAAESGDLLIENATVFNGEEFLENTDLEISGGIISNIGKNLASTATRRIDASGKTIIPGLIDAHTHTFGNALSLALNFGVTTQLDMFTAPSLLNRELSVRNNVTQAEQADLFSAGMLATVEGGHGTQFGIPLDTLSTPSEAEHWVEQRIQEGSDYIKLVYMPYSNYFKSLDRPTSAAIIQAAHKKGLIVVAHISSQRAAKELLEDGIDGFVHIFADQEISQEVLELAKSNDIFVIPTLSVIASADQVRLADELANDLAISDYLQPEQGQQLASSYGEHKIPGFELSTAIHNTKRLHQAGITILAGSDAPNPGTTYGASIHQELELLRQAGLSVSEAINAASINAVDAFRLNSIKHNDEIARPLSRPRGRLVNQAKADFIILNSSPQQSIKATRAIESIYKKGVKVARKKVTQAAQSSAGRRLNSPNLSDFGNDSGNDFGNDLGNGLGNDFGNSLGNGLTTDSQLVWRQTDDSMANGSSVASIVIDNSVLKISTTVRQGFMFPWAGASLFGKDTIDISDYTSLSFRVRGTIGQYQAMVFSGTQAGSPPSQSFSVDSEWQTVTLALSNFRGLDKTQLSGMAIVAGPKQGEFEYYLDDVKLLK